MNGYRRSPYDQDDRPSTVRRDVIDIILLLSLAAVSVALLAWAGLAPLGFGVAAALSLYALAIALKYLKDGTR